MARIQVFVTGWDELQETLLQISANAGERFLAPGLAAAARVVAVRARRTAPRGPNRRDPRPRRLYQTIRSGLFRSGRLKGRGARVLVGGRGATPANPVIAGQFNLPRARPYRGGPQSVPPNRFVTEAALQTQAGQEQAVLSNLRKRFPTLLRRLQRRSGQTRTLGATFGRRVALRGRRRR